MTIYKNEAWCKLTRNKPVPSLKRKGGAAKLALIYIKNIQVGADWGSWCGHN